MKVKVNQSNHNSNNENGGGYEIVEAGNHIGICYSIIHIGTIEDTFKGEKKMFNKVRIAWELPGERKEFKAGEGERPFTVSKEYTLAFNDQANLRKELRSWRGHDLTEKEESEGVDLNEMLGCAAMVNVIHEQNKEKTKTYAKVTGVTPLPKGMPTPAQFNESFSFWLDEERPFDKEGFAKISEYFQNKIKTSAEYSRMVLNKQKPAVEALEGTSKKTSDLPF